MIYPSLPARHDFLLFRISGSGLGNCLFTYFHGWLAAQQTGLPLLAPVWPSLRIGPWLRGEKASRRYGTLFRNHATEVRGARRWLGLLRGWAHRTVIDTEKPAHLVPVAGHLAVYVRSFTFRGLTAHRLAIRQHFLELLRDPPAQVRWGMAGYVALHVRMGDFLPGTLEDHLSGRGVNRRIPLSWFCGIVDSIRRARPDAQFRVFSDGTPAELRELLSLPGVTLNVGRHEIDDFLGLASAGLLVGSHSTFSHWAAFLGGMPSIWIATPSPTYADPQDDRPTLAVGRSTEEVPAFVAQHGQALSRATIPPANLS